MGADWKNPPDNITYLMEQILEHIPAPESKEGIPQMQITSLDYSPYVGRIAIGRVVKGELKENMPVALVKRDERVQASRIKELSVFDGLGRKKVEKVSAGEICAIVGLEHFEIGDTVTDPENPEGLAPITIDEPTMSMLFTINDSPFFGKEGKYVTSRHVKDRLDKELEKNLALRVEETGSADSMNVYGRGVLHLSILIETMRREGYELQVGQPQVIIKEIDGKKHEPVEELTIDLPEDYSGRAINLVTQRKGEMMNMEVRGERAILTFNIPSRGIIGLRSELLTATAGEAIMAHRFLKFAPYKGDFERRRQGSLIAHEGGSVFAYALDKLQDRGKFFIGPQEEVYQGQIVGESSRVDDLVINVTKAKKQSNVRAAGSDDKAKLAPPIKFSLEEALEYIQGDEYVEVTPESIRLRKVFLKEHERKRKKS
ncbi:UNVERIFIED_CONTAM: hypothetical protein GTU68_063893 [Idotea baltica]|nr:hypothetical protein [Idotea baltica]